MLLNLGQLDALNWVWLEHAIYEIANLFADLVRQTVATFFNFLKQDWHRFVVEWQLTYYHSVKNDSS
jgi:hypothetical protein